MNQPKLFFSFFISSQTCLYSFDAEPNTKVVAPIGTTQWITLSALNRLRRTDPSKVEPMWHSQYSVLQSWFGDASPFSLLQHVGFQGFLVTVLLDSAKGMVLRSLLVLGILSVAVLFMPVIEFFTNRFLVSGAFWSQWKTWGRIIHAALPLKLLIGQVRDVILVTAAAIMLFTLVFSPGSCHI